MVSLIHRLPLTQIKPYNASINVFQICSSQQQHEFIQSAVTIHLSYTELQEFYQNLNGKNQFHKSIRLNELNYQHLQLQHQSTHIYQLQLSSQLQ